MNKKEKETIYKHLKVGVYIETLDGETAKVIDEDLSSMNVLDYYLDKEIRIGNKKTNNIYIGGTTKLFNHVDNVIKRVINKGSLQFKLTEANEKLEKIEDMIFMLMAKN